MPSRTLHLLHVSDTHLGYRQYGIIEREKDLYDVFDEVVDRAIREHVDLVVHSGDFFDTTRPPPQAFKAAIKALRKLVEHNIRFVVVAGDHDVPKRTILSPLAVLDEVGLAYTIGVYTNDLESLDIKTKCCDVRVEGIRAQRGVAARQKLLELFKKLKPRSDKPSILLLHQTLREVAPEYELELRELPKGYSYYALGHIHVYRELNLGEAKVVYPGSPETMRIDEAILQPERYIVLAEVSQKTTISMQRITLERTRPILYLEGRYDKVDQLRAALLELKMKIKTIIAAGRKKPLLYMKLSIPRTIRTKIYSIIDQMLSSRILDYRLQIEPQGENKLKDSYTTLTEINLEKILEKELGDEKLAQLTLKLIEALNSEPRKYALKEAYSLIASFFGLEKEVTLK